MIFKQILSKLQVPFRGCYRMLVSPKVKLVPQLLFVHCASEVKEKLEISTPDALTHEYLLKQSSGVAVNAVAQLLHQAVSSYLDVANKYMKILNKHISLIEDFISKLGDVYCEEKIADSIIECRAEMKQQKEEFIQLESLLLYVENMVNSTTQTTFLAGAEYLSLTLCEQLNAAKREIQRVKKDVEIAEQCYLKAEKDAIEKEKKEKDKGENIFLKE